MRLCRASWVGRASLVPSSVHTDPAPVSVQLSVSNVHTCLNLMGYLNIGYLRYNKQGGPHESGYWVMIWDPFHDPVYDPFMTRFQR